MQVPSIVLRGKRLLRGCEDYTRYFEFSVENGTEVICDDALSNADQQSVNSDNSNSGNTGGGTTGQE